MQETEHARGGQENRRARLWALTGLLLVVALLLWFAAGFVILVFSAVLVGVFLAGLTDWLSGHSFLNRGWSLLVVVLGLALALGITGWLLAPRIAGQMSRLAEELPNAWQHVQEDLQQQPWGQQALKLLPSEQDLNEGSTRAIRKASMLVSSTLGSLANIILVLIVAVYLAADPSLYVAGLVRLLPQSRRARAREIFSALGSTLRRWLMGRLLLMILNAAVTSVALWLLGVPLAVTLGILAGLLNFVPNLGPIIAAIPAVLLGFMKGPMTALYVALVYVLYQALDGYVLTPLVQRKTVSMPPALVILTQVFLGIVWGIMGVLIAVPLGACVLVLVKMVYVEDVLGEKTDTP